MQSTNLKRKRNKNLDFLLKKDLDGNKIFIIL